MTLHLHTHWKSKESNESKASGRGNSLKSSDDCIGQVFCLHRRWIVRVSACWRARDRVCPKGGRRWSAIFTFLALTVHFPFQTYGTNTQIDRHRYKGELIFTYWNERRKNLWQNVLFFVLCVFTSLLASLSAASHERCCHGTWNKRLSSKGFLICTLRIYPLVSEHTH